MFKLPRTSLILGASSFSLFVLSPLKRAHFFPLSKAFTVFLALTLAWPQVYAQSPETHNGDQIFINDPSELKITVEEQKLSSPQEPISLPPISLNVTDPKPAQEINDSEISAGNTLFTVSAPLFEEIRHRMNTRFWQPLKDKSLRVYGYMALNIPRVAKDIKEAFRHPLKSGKNVTIVTTFLGTASTIISFTAGSISAGETDFTNLVAKGAMLLGLSALYRSNFDSIGAFLTYSGWSLKDIKQNVKLQKIYDENIKNLKNKEPEGLVKDTLTNRLIKSALIEVFFLAAASSTGSSEDHNKSKVTTGNYVLANIEYTFSNFVDALLSREMIKRKVSVKAATPEEIELKQNKISFAIKTLSIALAALQNVLVVRAINGDYKAHIALALFGGAVVLYEYVVDRRQKETGKGLSCSAVFAP